jgi:hypothetical protein
MRPTVEDSARINVIRAGRAVPVFPKRSPFRSEETNVGAGPRPSGYISCELARFLGLSVSCSLQMIEQFPDWQQKVSMLEANAVVLAATGRQICLCVAGEVAKSCVIRDEQRLLCRAQDISKKILRLSLSFSHLDSRRKVEVNCHGYGPIGRNLEFVMPFNKPSRCMGPTEMILNASPATVMRKSIPFTTWVTFTFPVAMS